jgi:hypothetical protein
VVADRAEAGGVEGDELVDNQTDRERWVR